MPSACCTQTLVPQDGAIAPLQPNQRPPFHQPVQRHGKTAGVGASRRERDPVGHDNKPIHLASSTATFGPDQFWRRRAACRSTSVEGAAG